MCFIILDPGSSRDDGVGEVLRAAIVRFRADFLALSGAREPGDRFGVAVSGGADSLGLLLLMHHAFSGRIAAATVDHRLRPEATDEARAVAAVCAGIGVPHRILTVERPIVGNVQSQARNVRYALLEAWCREEGLASLSTAHHADDQAETLMMRLLRGSGVGGLAGVRAARPIGEGGIALLRPVLDWRRAELAAVVAQAGLTPADDASNRDEHYDRVRMRRMLGDAAWIDPMPLARSAAALTQAEDALDWSARRLWHERVVADGDTLLLDPAGLPPELLRRLLTMLFAKRDSAPRGDQIQRLMALLASGQQASLAGLLCRPGDRWHFSPEPARKSI